MSTPNFVLATDGACSGNPGPGGWAFLLVCAPEFGTPVLLDMDGGNDPATTNNQMELMAAEAGLRAILNAHASGAIPQGASIALHFDATYALDGIFTWIPDWKARGWRKADKKQPANIEHWKRIDALVLAIQAAGMSLVKDWVKGHSGVVFNELADQFASDGRDAAKGGKPMPTARSDWMEWLETPPAKAKHPAFTIANSLRAQIAQRPSACSPADAPEALVAAPVAQDTTPPAPVAAPTAATPTPSAQPAGLDALMALEEAFADANIQVRGLAQMAAFYAALQARAERLGFSVIA